MIPIERFLPRNLLHKKEYVPQPFGIKYLEELSKSDLNELRRKVKKNKGVVQILVHPFHGDEENPTVPFNLRQEYKEERDIFLRTALATDVPLVIFEEEESVPHLQERINSDTGNVYVVPTLSGEARPSSVRRDSSYKPLFMNPREATNLNSHAWGKVIEPLRKAGVKKAVVGGKYMVLVAPASEREDMLLDRFRHRANGKKGSMELVSNGIFPSACPGQVMNELLANEIDISISPISSPTNKLEPTLLVPTLA